MIMKKVGKLMVWLSTRQIWHNWTFWVKIICLMNFKKI